MDVVVAVRSPERLREWEGILAERGHRVRRVAPVLEELLPQLEAGGAPLVIVERLAEGNDAFEACRRARRRQGTPRPILVVLLPTPLGGELIAALKAGADDVLVGPQRPSTIRARLAALELRVQPSAPAPTAGDLARFRWRDLEPIEADAARRVPEPAPPPAAVPAAPRAPVGPSTPPHAIVLPWLPDATLVVDADGTVVAANPAAGALFGLGEAALPGMPVDRLLRSGAAATPGPVAAQLRDAARRGIRHVVGCWGRLPDGREFPCEVSLAHVPAAEVRAHWIAVVREARPAPTSPLAAAFASVVDEAANDLNNALAAIGGGIETARRLAEGEATAVAELEHAQVGVRNAARLVRRLRQLTHPEPAERRVVDPVVLAQDVERQLARELPAAIRLVTRLEHRGWSVLVDPEQVVDLVLAFALRARDAMAQGGTLALRTARVTQAVGGSPRDFVRLDVADTGAAEDEGVGGHWPRGAGAVALADLAGAPALLAQQGAHLTLGATPGGGTIVSLYLPRAAAAPAPAEPTPGTPAEGTILLVDDDPDVRRPLRQALEHCGFRVLEAGDGEEGLELHARHAAEVRVAVVDHRMPRMSGWTLLGELKRRAPGLPVVLVSGSTLRELQPEAGGVAPDAFLRKPFELGDLANTVRRLIQATALATA